MATSTKKAPAKAAPKKAAKAASKKAATKRASKKSVITTTSQSEAQKKRVAAAFKDKNLRQVVHDINNEFPQIRTADLHNKCLRILRGDLFDLPILEAIEKLDATEESTD